MNQPYRALTTKASHKYPYEGSKLVQVMRFGAWHWGPFAGGFIRWGDEVYRVLGTRWFTIWFKCKEPL